jgi:hypothetical protein
VGVAVEVLDPLGVEGAGAADDAVDEVALGEEELGEVGAVLAGDAGDESDFAAVVRHGASIVVRGQGRLLIGVGGRHVGRRSTLPRSWGDANEGGGGGNVL